MTSIRSSTSTPVPVVLIVYNRPDFAEAALKLISLSDPAQVLIISDGPRPEVAGDREVVRQVREACDQSRWNFPIQINAAETNMGLRRRIISGLDWVFSQCEAAIILEDDCAPDSTFFSYAESVLGHHASSDKLGVVSGNNFCGKFWENDYSYGFSTTARIWGWATWRHVWQGFSAQDSIQFSWTEEERDQVLSAIDGGVRRRAMKKMMSSGENLDAWSLAFAVYLLRKGLLNVVPQKNLVENIGFGRRSTHTKFESYTAQVPAEAIELPLLHPRIVEHDEWIEHAESRHYLKRFIGYPLRHPVDVAGRLWRYLTLRRGR
jgi:hypothetical protein